MFRFGTVLTLIGVGLLLATLAVSPLPLYAPGTHRFQAVWPSSSHARYDDQGRRLESGYSHWPEQRVTAQRGTGIWR